VVRRLLLLNGLGVVSVILFHATGWGFTAMFSENWTARYEALEAGNYDVIAYHTLRGIEQLVSFAIVAFVFVSGFFVAVAAGQCRSSVGWKPIISRLKYLIIPYALWSGLIWIALGLEGRIFTPGDYGLRFLTGATDPAYYYVPLLAQLYLISPLLVPIAKHHWKWLIGSLALLQIIVYLAHYPGLLNIDIPAADAFVRVMPKWFFPVRIFWFALGMVVGFHIRTLKDALVRLRWVWLSATAVMLVLGILEWEVLVVRSGSRGLQTQETLIDGLYGLGVILTFLAFSNARLPFAGELSSLGSKSYGIYLIHSPVMQYLSRALYHLAPGVLAHQFLLLALLIVCGLGLPLLLMFAVNRSPARPYYAYQFG